jgi:hypothetical protein
MGTMAFGTAATAATAAAQQAPVQRAEEWAPQAGEPSQSDAGRSRRRLWFSARGALGLGEGGDGFGGRLAASATAWPLYSAGITAEYATGGDGVLFGANEEFSVLTLGPSLRLQNSGVYLQLDLLFGAGSGRWWDATNGGFFDEPIKHRLSGLAATGNLGLFFHPAFLELGPALSFTAYDHVELLALNFELGFAI